MENPPRTRHRPLVLLVMAVGLLSACDALTLSREPENARVRIDSENADSVTLVTSRWFLQVPDPECPNACVPVIQLVEADTAVVQLPFEGTYAFDFRLQFFAETYPMEPSVVTLAMSVHLDDEEWFNDFRQLQPQGQDGEQETLRFIYEYNTITLP